TLSRTRHAAHTSRTIAPVRAAGCRLRGRPALARLGLTTDGPYAYRLRNTGVPNASSSKLMARVTVSVATNPAQVAGCVVVGEGCGIWLREASRRDLGSGRRLWTGQQPSGKKPENMRLPKKTCLLGAGAFGYTKGGAGPVFVAVGRISPCL